MWITRYINEKAAERSDTSLGSVSSNVGSGVEVNASAAFRNIPPVSPYGVEYVPPVGESALITEVQNRRVCLGVLNSGSGELSPGEIRLYSKCGASLTLKNDGRILLEGRLFINGEEVTL